MKNVSFLVEIFRIIVVPMFSLGNSLLALPMIGTKKIGRSHCAAVKLNMVNALKYVILTENINKALY